MLGGLPHKAGPRNKQLTEVCRDGRLREEPLHCQAASNIKGEEDLSLGASPSCWLGRRKEVDVERRRQQHSPC